MYPLDLFQIKPFSNNRDFYLNAIHSFGEIIDSSLYSHKSFLQLTLHCLGGVLIMCLSTEMI